MSLVQNGNLPAATSRVKDLEVTWDNAQARLKSINSSQWSVVDKSIDTVLQQLQAEPPNPGACKTSLESLISTLDMLDHRK